MTGQEETRPLGTDVRSVDGQRSHSYPLGGGHESPESDEMGSQQHQPGLRSSHVVMVGVPAEVAVAIALASFFIGAALTGMLCCVHHRKAAQKGVRKSRSTVKSIVVA